MSPPGNFPHLSCRTRREEMLCMMNNRYLPRRVARCGFYMLAFLIVLAGCGGSSNTASTSTATAVVGTTNNTPSPTSTQPGATPTQSKPSPTPPTKAKPIPTPTRTTPTPTPTRATPTPTPTPKPSPTLTPPTTVKVSIISNGSFAFSPQTVNISIGTIVIWKNNTTVPHTVSSDNGTFDSATISPGGTFSFKFTQAGTFAYHCNIHPFMTATVIVK